MVAAGPAGADALLVDVSDGRGAPVSDAVITLVPRGAVSVAHAPATHTIDQKDETFIPYVEIFRPGDHVLFSNSDHTRHHVYSFSPAGTFEYVLAPGQSSTPYVLEHGGIVAVGCNIHDHMIAYLYVSDAAWAARTQDGHASFASLPAGEYAVRLWHPQLRHDQPEQVVKLGGTAHVAFTVSLLPDPRRAPDAERSEY